MWRWVSPVTEHPDVTAAREALSELLYQHAVAMVSGGDVLDAVDAVVSAELQDTLRAPADPVAAHPWRVLARVNDRIAELEGHRGRR